MNLHKKTILVVEDNPDHLELTLLSLQGDGSAHEMAVAYDGAQALDYLFGQGAHSGRDTTDQPELVLLDLKLPKLTGLEVLQRMREDPRTATVPVVILTSSSEQEDILACYQGGANSFVRKPVNFADYADKLRQVQAYWLRVNESRAAS
jgi:two-component system, response regulator